MKKILLIEDNVDLAENIATLLGKEGYVIHTEFNGEGGLQAIIDFKPDLILCDILLPGTDGYSVLKQLKKIEGTVLPIFIFITAKSQRDELRKGMVLGAEDYLTKPFTYEELLETVKVQFQKRSRAFNKINTNVEGRGHTYENVGHNSPKNSSFEKANVGYDEYVFLKSKKDSGFFLIDDIIVIRSLKDYTNIYLKGNKSFVLHKTMIEWEKKLPPQKFLRIHKQTLINMKYIEKVELISSHRFLITLSHYVKKLEVSQRYSRKMKKLFQ